MTEDSLRHYPLGNPMPASPHAVCVSIPTMEEIIGYETKDPVVMEKIQTGYPRFVTHPLVNQACQWFEEGTGVRDRAIIALNSSLGIDGLRTFVGCEDLGAEEREGVVFAHFPDTVENRALGKLFTQHTGCGASSRRAEDLLVRTGRLSHPHAEALVEDEAESLIRENLGEAFGGIEPEEILLAASGMNAFHSLFQAIRATRRPRGRTVWVQLGWLYVDTLMILQKFLGPDEELVVLQDLTDLASISRLLRDRGQEIAAVVTESPTNPLMQTCDLPALYELCGQSGAFLIADPTGASPRNVDVLPYCDALVNSLTKYSANEGDVMLGSLVFSPSSNAGDMDEIRERTKPMLEPPFSGDLHRLAAQIPAYEEVVRQSNRNLMGLVSFLESRSEIRKIHWAYSPATEAHFESIARSTDSPGCLFSVELNLPLSDLYDALRLLKSPSFGCKFSLVCPYMYIAHYDLVSTNKGRAFLEASGLEPDLLRISVGGEPLDDLIAVFEEGFRLAAKS